MNNHEWLVLCVLLTLVTGCGWPTMQNIKELSPARADSAAELSIKALS
jgi:hypothetical protein